MERPAGATAGLMRLRPTLRDVDLVVVVAAACQAVTILWTAELWRPRTSPPNLPVAGWLGWLADVNWGPPLLVLAAAAVVVPRLASPAFCAAFVLAALGDQTRLQPEFVSLGLLMTAPLYGRGGRSVARWHLSSLWLWAGLHKVLSLGWGGGGAVAIAGFLDRPELRSEVAWLLPASEIGIGLLSLWPRAWPVVRWAGLGLHLGILLTLSPLFGDWNSSVWPWNLGLGVAALVLFSRRAPRPAPAVGLRVALALLLAYPALFYIGVTDAYLAHNLYTSNTASAAVCDAGGRCAPAPFDTWGPLNVPLPPEPRLYRQWFDEVCAPGAVLVVTGRQTRLTDPPSVDRHACPQ